MRRRRRNRGTWLPLDPTVLSEGEPAFTYFTTTTAASDTIGERPTSVVAVPVAFDITRQTPDNIGTEFTMRDLTEGQDYFLDRIVGKVDAEFDGNQGTLGSQILDIVVCMAFAILAVEDDGTTVALAADDIDPLLAKNTMAPFIWRRTWKLYNNLTPGGLITTVPSTVAQYGSVMDGGHVDAKTKRRIRQNERLFFLYQTVTTGTLGIEPGGSVTFGFDLRLHGALRKNRNQGTFR